MTLSELKKYVTYDFGIYGQHKRKKFSILVLIIEKNEELFFVFQKRNKNIRQGGEISFPGGAFDVKYDRTLEETAIRETIEEMGVLGNDFSIIGRLDTILTHNQLEIAVFLGLSHVSLESFIPNKDEVEEIFAIPIDYFLIHEPLYHEVLLEVSSIIYDQETQTKKVLFPAKELGLPEKYHKKWISGKQDIALYETKYGFIWGLTAQIILNFIDKVNIKKEGFL